MMKKYFEVEEDTEFHSGRVEILGSGWKPGTVLLQLWMTDKKNGRSDSAGIRLTRDQARELANQLNSLADQLFFEEQREKECKIS